MSKLSKVLYGTSQSFLSALMGFIIGILYGTTVAAGDCFLGAFASGLAEKMPFNKALGVANCAAALSVQKVGTTTSFPRRKDVENLAKRQ
jgi:fructose-1-phosphate kinase PfkB-like protein